MGGEEEGEAVGREKKLGREWGGGEGEEEKGRRGGKKGGTWEKRGRLGEGLICI